MKLRDQSGTTSVRYARVEDTTWPIYDGDVEWALRYGSVDREAQLYLASVLSAYDHLTRPDARPRTVMAALRRARKARSG